MHLEDYSRQISVRLMEAKNEQRAQHAVSITSLKEITAAIKSLDEAIRLGTEQNQMNPGGCGAGTTPATAPGGTPAPGGTGATMAAPPATGTPATPAGDGTGVPVAVPATTAGGSLPPPPGYGSSVAHGFPPPAPVFTASPPMAYQPPANRAGRLRVTNRDGTLAARAVSPQGRPPSAVTADWVGEFGLGTVNFNGAVYRVLPDSYLEGSIPLN